MSSSAYSAAQLEAMRRERIRESIKSAITEVAKNKDKSTISSERKFTYEYTNVDEGTSGATILSEAILEQERILNMTALQVDEKAAMDLTDLLVDRGENIFADKFKEMISRLQERKVYSGKAKEAKARLIHWMNEMLRDENYDIEAKYNQISSRIDNYLLLNPEETEPEVSDLAIYSALCAELSIPEQAIDEEHRRREIERMFNVLQKREERTYIKDTMEQIMEDFGLFVEESCILDESEGILFSSEDNRDCKIFMAADGSGVLMETIATANVGDDATKQRTEERARHICKLQEQIKEEARKRGIILQTDYLMEPDFAEMYREADMKKTGENVEKLREQRRRRNAIRNERSMKL